MIERDYLMRQIRQMVQVLQEVLNLRKQGQVDEARQHLQRAFHGLSEEEHGTLRTLSLEETLHFCNRGGSFKPEFAVRVADLLKEEGEVLAEQGRLEEAQQSWVRALLLYRRAMREQRAALPWNIGASVSGLEAKVDGTPEAEAVDRLLDAEG